MYPSRGRRKEPTCLKIQNFLVSPSLSHVRIVAIRTCSLQDHVPYVLNVALLQAVAERKQMATIEELQVEHISVDDLQAHPENPRHGNTEMIADSLKRYGQYRPIIANSRNGYIVAGHHIWRAAQSLGWPTVKVTKVDVDEDTHRRIMLIDNRSSDVGTYSEDILAQILSNLDNPTEGTGYTDSMVDDILSRLDQEVELPQGDTDAHYNEPDELAEQREGQYGSLGDKGMTDAMIVLSVDDMKALKDNVQTLRQMWDLKDATLGEVVLRATQKILAE